MLAVCTQIDLAFRSQSLYPTELAARVSKNIKMLAVCTQIDLAVRSQSLYPTELAARISKNIKMLAICTQIDLAVRSQSLYPAELPAHFMSTRLLCSTNISHSILKCNTFFILFLSWIGIYIIIKNIGSHCHKLRTRTLFVILLCTLFRSRCVCAVCLQT